MFPKYIQFQLYTFNLCGFCPEILAPKIFKRNCRIALFLVHLLILCANIALTAEYFQNNLNYFDFIEKANDALKMFSSVIAYAFVIIESYTKRQTQQNFWKTFQCIQENYCYRQRTISRNYYLKFVAFFIYNVFIQYFLLRWSILQNKPNFLKYWFGYILILTNHQMRVFYYLFYMELLRTELNFVNQELTVIVMKDLKGLRRFQNRVHRSFVCKRLIWVREYYRLIFELSCLLNHSFGWSHITSITFSFFLFISDFNWGLWYIYNNVGEQLEGKFDLWQSKVYFLMHFRFQNTIYG